MVCVSCGLITFPYLDICGDKMGVCTDVIFCQRFIPFLTEISEYEENLAVFVWGSIEIVHSLIPRCYFSTRHIPAFCPRVCFALNEDLLLMVAEIEVVLFLSVYTDFDRNMWRKVKPLFSKEFLRYDLKIVANLSIA